DIKIMSDHMQKSRQRLDRILAENTGRSVEEIALATERDNYMSAQEALEFGLVDKVIAKRAV
ncbi:MAG: ATP-dependent Clp protease proteolytic subunit, partial [Lachnospiraceae bacterium]|nr:ATP-dependent Clp protease proteolytic subunit [Lachnospiraceae bacterium]